MTTKERLIDLEKRMSIVEQSLKDRHEKLDALIQMGEQMLTEFAETYGFSLPEIK